VRRHGIGTALAVAQENWAWASGASDLVCDIPDTSPAVRLAEQSGWQRTEETSVAKNRLVERRWVKATG
jgi:glutamine phosphoribosylpyrophosphate amidotransferase